MRHSLLRGSLLLSLALVLGFALMGFEMLGSRYLYPYFGGGINTWASLIATVLVALMLGYLLGGALVDRTMSPRLCGALLVVAGVYLFTIPLWVDPLFAWMLTSVGDGMAGIVLAATGFGANREMVREYRAGRRSSASVDSQRSRAMPSRFRHSTSRRMLMKLSLPRLQRVLRLSPRSEAPGTSGRRRASWARGSGNSLHRERPACVLVCERWTARSGSS